MNRILFQRAFSPANLGSYRGKIKAVILDWSGTICDAGVLAPAVSFVETFRRVGVPITMTEARLPMGLRKDVHISKILEMPRVREEWKNKFGEYPTMDVVNKLFKSFVPIQLACLKDYATIIPGADVATQTLRKNNILLGCTTGFTRVMTEILRTETEKQGVVLDSSVAGDEVKNGTRPAPFMIYKNLDLLGVYPISSVIKVDDTEAGIREGLNAGCWTVGVSRWANCTNYDSLEQLKSISKEDVFVKEYNATNQLIKENPHYIIPDITHLPEVVENINTRLYNGEQP